MWDGMESEPEQERFVRFPCDLPQWDKITQALIELRENLCVDPSPWQLVKQLNFIYQLAQDSVPPEKAVKKQKEFKTFTAGKPSMRNLFSSKNCNMYSRTS